ncbi:MAG: hypothetical protein L0G64_09305 [Acinetobacter sp.]|nr:hypothetical protein [Acinetobacter sp.]
MKYAVLATILGGLLVASFFSLGIGFYLKDSLLLAIGVLLLVAAILLFFEFNKIKNDPFS